MARIFEPTESQQREWAKWVSKRPPKVRAVAERFTPWTLYRMKTGSRSRVYIHSFGEYEDGSVSLTVNVTGQFNLVSFDRTVFGIKPEELEECDLPSADEPLGTVFTEKVDIDDYLDVVRPHILAKRKAH